MRLRYESLNSFFVCMFVLVASLLGTQQSDLDFLVIKEYELPSFIIDNIFYVYVLLLSATIISGGQSVLDKPRIYKEHLILLTAYGILLIWAVATVSDIIRYSLIFISILFVPKGVKRAYDNADVRLLTKGLFFVFVILILISYVYSLLNIDSHNRFSGFHNNPNLMGMWLVSFIALMLCFENKINKTVVILFCAFSFFLILMTGSRLALIGFLIVLSPYYKKMKIRHFLIYLCFGVILILGFFASQINIDINIRAFDIFQSIWDSGRADIWVNAIECITKNPMIGSGMDGAEICVGIGNVHNTYLRVAVMLGLPLAVVFFALFFTFIWCVVKSPVNPFIKSYFASLPVAFFAEDYAVGFGSPFFPFLLLMLSMFYVEKKVPEYQLNHW